MLNDAVKKYNTVFKILESSSNPKIQLAAIIDFFLYLESQGSTSLIRIFLPDFINFIINIFKNSNVDYIDPEILIVSKYLLTKANEDNFDDIISSEICCAIELINIKLLVAYYYLGEIENGLSILNDILNSKVIIDSETTPDTPESKNNIYRKNKFSLVNPNLFKVNKVFDILKKINYELKKIDSNSCDSVNVLFIESDKLNYDNKRFGTIKSLECKFLRNNNSSVNLIIDNITDIHDSEINSIKNCLINASNMILGYFKSGHITGKSQIVLRFSELRGIYKGASFGAGAAILIPAAFLDFSNSRKKYSIANSVAFSGSVDKYGELIALPFESLKAKIECAFYSWLKYVVVPEENYNDAAEIINTLNKKYPGKNLELIKIKNIKDVLSDKNFIKIEKDKLIPHSQKIIKRHSTSSFSVLTLALLLLSFWGAYKFIPRNIKPLPEMKQQLNLAYCPDRDTVWKFFSEDKAGGDTIDFGETAIGDNWSYRLLLLNNGNDKEPLTAEITGRDKDEFDVSWERVKAQKGFRDFTYNDIKQRIFIKFNPYKETGSKEADLVFYNRKNPDNRKIFHLKGNSGVYKNGYSLNLKNDDNMTIDPKGNFLKNEFTISFWFKINKTGLNILSDGTPGWTQTKFELHTNDDSTLLLTVINSIMSPNDKILAVSKSKLKFDEWNFCAVSHLNNKTMLILNDEARNIETKEDHMLQIEDYLFFGDKHPLQSAISGYRNDDWNLKISEFRVYKKALSKEEIFSKKFIKENPSNSELSLYYDFDESDGKEIFTGTKNDIFGYLHGLAGRTLDYPPVNNRNLLNSVSDTNDYYVRVYGKGVCVLYKNIFTTNSDFTIQFDVKAGGNLKQPQRQYFNIDNFDLTKVEFYHSNDSLMFGYHNIFDDISEVQLINKKIDNAWHKYSFTYSLEKNTLILYIDCKKSGELNLGSQKYDISNPFYLLSFGNSWLYDNPRFFAFDNSIDNISIFNKALNEEEIKITDIETIKNIKGLLALWTFNKIDGRLCYDEVNRIPIFIWDSSEICTKN